MLLVPFSLWSLSFVLSKTDQLCSQLAHRGTSSSAKEEGLKHYNQSQPTMTTTSWSNAVRTRINVERYDPAIIFHIIILPAVPSKAKTGARMSTWWIVRCIHVVDSADSGTCNRNSVLEAELRSCDWIDSLQCQMSATLPGQPIQFIPPFMFINKDVSGAYSVGNKNDKLPINCLRVTPCRIIMGFGMGRAGVAGPNSLHHVVLHSKKQRHYSRRSTATGRDFLQY